MSKLLIAIVGCLPLIASAEVFKCTESGRTVYTDKPCAGAGTKIEIRDTRSGDDTGMVNASMTNITDAMVKDRRSSEIRREVAAREENIRTLRVAMQKEIREIQQAKGYANNNLAGATWQQSLSTQQEAVTKRYEIEIAAEQRAIDRLIEERGRL